MQTNEIQELLLDTIPAWHYWFARPFKRMLNDGVSLDMYYCIQSMRRSGRTMTMTELANFARMPKQQMSKLVDKLVEGGFAERLSDPDDRRVIRVNLTDAGRERSKCDLEEMRSAICWIFSQMGERRTREFVDLLSEFSTYMAICHPGAPRPTPDEVRAAFAERDRRVADHMRTERAKAGEE